MVKVKEKVKHAIIAETTDTLPDNVLLRAKAKAEKVISKAIIKEKAKAISTARAKVPRAVATRAVPRITTRVTVRSSTAPGKPDTLAISWWSQAIRKPI